jgi:saposin
LTLSSSIPKRPLVKDLRHFRKIPTFEEGNGMGCTICTKVVNYVEEYIKEGKPAEVIEQLLEEKVCALAPALVQSICDNLVQNYIPLIINYLEQEMEAADICAKLGLCPTNNSVRVSYEEVNGMGCTICTSLVDFVENYLKEGKPTQQIIELVETKFCASVPAFFADICDNLADKYIPLIISYLEQEIEALDICVKLGLCQPTARNLVLTKDQDGVACSICTKIVNYVDQYIQEGKPTQKIIELIETNVCAKAPEFVQGICDNLAQYYIPQIINFLEQKFEALDICGKLGLCKGTQARTAKNDGAGCTICTKIVNYVEEYIKEGKPAEVIEQLLEDKVCALAPALVKTICDNLVQNYIPLIINYLEQEMEAADICAKLGLCSESNGIRIPTFHDVDTCELCKNVVMLIEDYLEEGQTEEEIEQFLNDKICPLFPETYQAVCTTIATTMVPQIIQYLADKFPPEDVCAKLGICTSTVARRLPKAEDNGFTCVLCENVVRMIDDYLEDGKTQAEIEALLQKFCDKIKAPYGAICDSLVQQYIPKIIEYLEQKLEPTKICTLIKLCNEEKKAPRKAKTTTENGELFCAACKYFINWAEGKLSTISAPAIYNLIEKECPKIPYIKKFCTQITEQQVQAIVDMLIQKIPGDKICAAIHFC